METDAVAPMDWILPPDDDDGLVVAGRGAGAVDNTNVVEYEDRSVEGDQVVEGTGSGLSTDGSGSEDGAGEENGGKGKLAHGGKDRLERRGTRIFLLTIYLLWI